VVVSDTHQLAGDRVLEALGDALEGVDGIIHCGDIVGIEVIEALEERAPVVAVSGNMDTIDVKRRYPKREILEVGGLKIGVVHGWGSPHGIISKILYSFRADSVDAIFFGHTHEAFLEERDGIFLLNPGSLLDRVFTRVNSYAVVEVEERVRGKIVEIVPE